MYANQIANTTAIQVVAAFNREFFCGIDEMRKEIWLQVSLSQSCFFRDINAAQQFLKHELTPDNIESWRVMMFADLYPILKTSTPILIERGIKAIMSYVTNLVLKGRINALNDLQWHSFADLLVKSLRKSDVMRFNKALTETITEPFLQKISKQRAEEAACGDGRQLPHGVSLWHQQDSLLNEAAYQHQINESFELSRIKL